tara:strand:+ start:80 stop:421 length:342 start_codon:yes stop_codon:yes gene_type:complete
MSEITIKKPSKAEQWAGHIKGWEQSKLSQPEYCKQSGIGYAAFVYWRGRLSKDNQTTKAKFASVTVKPNKPATGEVPKSIQIKLVTGHVVYIPTHLPVNDIAALISALGSPYA